MESTTSDIGENTAANSAELEAYYGLPTEVKFCKTCTISNQRPSSTIEQKHTKKTKKEYDMDVKVNHMSPNYLNKSNSDS